MHLNIVDHHFDGNEGGGYKFKPYVGVPIRIDEIIKGKYP